MKVPLQNCFLTEKTRKQFKVTKEDYSFWQIHYLFVHSRSASSPGSLLAYELLMLLDYIFRFPSKMIYGNFCVLPAGFFKSAQVQCLPVFEELPPLQALFPVHLKDDHSNLTIPIRYRKTSKVVHNLIFLLISNYLNIGAIFCFFLNFHINMNRNLL